MVQGLVSHMETDCFWLLVELDRVARLTLCMKESMWQLEEGECVVGRLIRCFVQCTVN